MVKKTFYYNFLPPKPELEPWIGINTPNQVSRVLVEIRDVYSAPVIDYQNPWQIKKTLTQYEVVGGKIVIPFLDTFEHIFRYWSLDIANRVVLGQKVSVLLWDVTEQNNPRKYQGDTVFFQMVPNDDDYVLACMNLFNDRNLEIDDEIGLFFDPRVSYFQFKLFRKVIL